MAIVIVIDIALIVASVAGSLMLVDPSTAVAVFLMIFADNLSRSAVFTQTSCVHVWVSSDGGASILCRKCGKRRGSKR